MTVNNRCRCCGSTILANKEKLLGVIGGTALVTLMGLQLSTPTGWISIIAGAWGGSKAAQQILNLKLKLLHATNRAGGWFRCSGCGRDVPIGEVFGD